MKLLCHPVAPIRSLLRERQLLNVLETVQSSVWGPSRWSDFVLPVLLHSYVNTNNNTQKQAVSSQCNLCTRVTLVAYLHFIILWFMVQESVWFLDIFIWKRFRQSCPIVAVAHVYLEKGKSKNESLFWKSLVERQPLFTLATEMSIQSKRAYYLISTHYF